MHNQNKAFSLIELSIVILIIGILVVGVTQSSRLVSQMKLATARQLTTSSPVASIKNLSLWLEPTLEKSFDVSEASDDSFVTNWFDINPQTSNKIVATQSNQSFKPKYYTNEINGLPALRFDGNSDWMTLGVILGLESNSKITVFVVNKFATNTKNFILAKQDNQVDGKGWNLVFWNGNFELGILGNQSTNAIRASTILSNKSTYLVAASYNGNLSSAGMNIWINGEKINPTRTSTLNLTPSPNGSEDFRIGAREDNSFGWFHGSIGEIIIFNDSLTDSDIIEVNNYLKKKWTIK